MIPKDDTTKSPAAVSGWTSVAALEDQQKIAELKPAQATETQYVLVWLTSLPKDGGGYRGEIAEVTVQK